MKVALAFSSKDRVELTKQTIPWPTDQFDLFWNDGSTTEYGRDYFEAAPERSAKQRTRVTGGADAAIVFALTQMLADPSYTHVGLLENDVLLTKDWFGPTVALFKRGADEGLEVGAVSARAYEDRVLCQRDGYALMHNLGAGHVIYTREAAELILAKYRTGWWTDNRAIFAQLSGLDIGRWACFRGNQQWITADWGFDTVLANHGLASLALTPSPVEMIGQVPSLEEQGLKLVTQPVELLRNNEAFELFAERSMEIRDGLWLPQAVERVHRSSGNGGASIYFAHQLLHLKSNVALRLKWVQGFGPFAFRTAKITQISFPVYGPCVVMLSSVVPNAKAKLIDSSSGYEIESELSENIMQFAMPAGVSYRDIEIKCDAGVVFHGIQTSEPQPTSNLKFNYHSLPPVE